MKIKEEISQTGDLLELMSASPDLTSDRWLFCHIQHKAMLDDPRQLRRPTRVSMSVITIINDDI